MAWLGRIEKATAQFIDRVFTKLTGVESVHPGLQLRMIHGLPPGAVFPFARATTIGRGAMCDIMLNDPSVSRKHARIEFDAQGAIVKDLASTNGTFVNGERITARHVQVGDLVRFGKTELRVEALS